MDFLNLASQSKKFEDLLNKVLTKIEKLDRRVQQTNQKMAVLEHKVISLGQACGRAFEQTKTVVNSLKDATENIGESLDEYGGVIEASSFDW